MVFLSGNGLSIVGSEGVPRDMYPAFFRLRWQFIRVENGSLLMTFKRQASHLNFSKLQSLGFADAERELFGMGLLFLLWVSGR